MIYLFIMVGCSPDKVSDTGTDPEEEIQFQNLGGPSDPTLDIDELLLSTKNALESGLPTPPLIRDTYASFLVNREYGCPMMENSDTTSWVGVWFDSCTTNSGYGFFGTALYGENLIQDGDTTDWSYELVSSYELWDPNNYVFIGGGEVELELLVEGENSSWFGRIGGTYSYVPGVKWLSEGGEISLFMEGNVTEGEKLLRLDGGVGYQDVQFSFTRMIMDSKVCDGVPQGIFRIRDESTYWFEMEFTDCSNCATVQWRDKNQGEACLGESIGIAGDQVITELLNFE
jgi:hypothetical protein